MSDEDKSELTRALQFLGRSVGVDLESLHVATTTDDLGARAQMHDGRLQATVFPNRAGSVQVEGPRVPGIDIELVDPTRGVDPEGAVYKIMTYIPEEDVNRMVPGAIYVNAKGEFLTYRRAVKFLDP